MPGHPDPRLNLAITLEKAGQTDAAILAFETALEVFPDYLPAAEGIAGATLRSGRTDTRLKGWLQKIAMQSESPRWQEWAEGELSRLQ